MRRTNSFSNDIIGPNKNDINEEKMFLSMKETLHNPLQIIKSKELLNCVYKEKNIDKDKEKEKGNNIHNNQIIEVCTENQNIISEKSKEELSSNNNINDKENIYFLEKDDKELGRNNFLEKYKIIEKEKTNSEMIDYNTSPNTNSGDNIDKIGSYENNNIINTEPLKDNNYSLKEKNAMKEIKNLAQKIKNEINTFEICENISKFSLEQSKHNNDIYHTSTNNNINNPCLPFEFINYSFSDITNNTKKNNNDNYKNKINSKINNIKIEEDVNKENKNKSKEKKENYNYRNYIQNSPDIKIRRPDGDIYTREMEFKKKKDLKLEQMRKKEYEEEMSELQYRPRINNISKKMTKNKTPIYKRLKEIEIEKNNKLEKIKENINRNNQEYISKTKQKFNEEDFKKWLVSNENWNVKKTIKLNNIKKEVKIEEELNNDELKFHPKINKNSEKLFKSNYSLSSIPVSDRLCYGKENKEENSHKKQKGEKLTFIPKINKYYPISDKYYEFMEIDQFQVYNKNNQNSNM